jgi:hypothetical protein
VTRDRADLDAGSQFAMPVSVVQQDWGAQLGFDAAALWRVWAPDGLGAASGRHVRVNPPSTTTTCP